MPQFPDLYAAHAATIESALAQASRSHRLAPDAGDEFCSWARVRLLDHDQAILRKFQERSALRTFLITVVQRLYLDWRNAEWGKWRPTAEARRLGAVAIELERLVLRDQLSYDEAVRTLAARGAATPDECERVWCNCRDVPAASAWTSTRWSRCRARRPHPISWTTTNRARRPRPCATRLRARWRRCRPPIG